MKPEQTKPSRVRRLMRLFGPGVITGAVNDDPSAVTTYSIAGAHYGLAFAWTALFTWSLIGVVQMACARIGLITGKGLVSALRNKIPKLVLLPVCVALFAANALNLGADLSGMADAAELLTGINGGFYIVLFGVTILRAFFYDKLASMLKWLCLFLFAYVVAAFLVVDDWSAVLKIRMNQKRSWLTRLIIGVTNVAMFGASAMFVFNQLRT